MSASARGTQDAPGKRVRAKSGLNRSILDQGWAAFRTMLAYKLEGHGGELIAVPPAYTSQTCRMCHHVSAANRASQARFACESCGHTEHADLNAAHNILAAGHAVWARRTSTPAACGEVVRRPERKPSVAASAKQEPTEALSPA